MPDTRPNVILVCVDEWRGDCLSAAGHPHVQTPHLDDLARRGTRFANGYSATPTCVPARVALFTGQSQERHGRVGYTDGVPFDVAHPVTLQGEFRKAGYHTQAIGKMHVFPERSRSGFDDVVLHDGFLHFARRAHGRNFPYFDDYVPWLRRQPGVSPDEDYFDHGVCCNSVVARPWDKSERLHPTSWAGGQVVDWLYRRDPTKPFFLYLSFHRPHPPYDPPQWAFDTYMDLPEREHPVGNWEHHYDSVRSDDDHTTFVGTLAPGVRHRARAGYYGSMAHVDLQINRLVETLMEFGVYDNTVIAFTSDHGEMMGDHDMYRKGVGFEGSAHVPFIVAGAPNDDGVGKNQVVDDVVELRDIAPTLLDLAGLEVPESCDGRSLVPFLRGDQVHDWRDWLHGEHTLFGQSLQWVTDGHVKYLWASGWGTDELFDLDSDPGELRNLADDPEHAELRDLWRSRLIGDLTGREEGFVRDGDLVAGAAAVEILGHTRTRLAEAGVPGYGDDSVRPR
ncbi:arylsulfatase [Spelaeicoccus albus]|uniref:Arylsulfatase A-like enzyme n=1 Tax=Spelaeicoccus albus TaxID=1280376 RepID=A0A7Z0D0C0_9MICO|nr:arylsulfatase [Spelaeicoccus albus]NYI67196.1 arylsulfatase A-like enzyme [Spelaeicoccus albus]